VALEEEEICVTSEDAEEVEKESERSCCSYEAETGAEDK